MVFIVGFAFLYSAGGTEGMGGKWLRRFLAPTELGIGMFIFSRDWRVFLQVSLMMGTLCLGYGSDDTIIKILKRLLYGAANGLSSSSYVIYRAMGDANLWFMVALQNISTIMTCVVLGVWNGLSSARAEEFAIGIVISAIPMMFAKKRK